MFRIISIFIFTFCIGHISNAQNSAFKFVNQGDKKAKKMDYHGAIRSYQGALDLEPNNKKALEGVVEIYLNVFEVFDSAEIYILRQIDNIGAETDTNYLIYYNYANCLRMQEKHKEAIDQYQFFLHYGLRRARPDHPLIAQCNKNINYSLNALKNQKMIYEPFEVENMDFFINSVDAEYTPVYIEDENLLLYNARYKDYDTEHRDCRQSLLRKHLLL